MNVKHKNDRRAGLCHGGVCRSLHRHRSGRLGSDDEQLARLKTRLQPIVAERIAQVSETGIDGQAACDMLCDEIVRIEAEE